MTGQGSSGTPPGPGSRGWEIDIGEALFPERIAGIDLASLPKDPMPPDHWQHLAACYGVDPEVFFPVAEDDAGPALAHCAACPIRETCLAWALKNGERYGVWGGLTEQQRRHLHRRVA